LNIYIDESGSFVSAPNIGSWNVVVAVAVPESERYSLDASIKALKAGMGPGELKLNALSEKQYLNFLAALANMQVALFGTATDAGLNTRELVLGHQRVQVANVRKNIPKMKYEGGRQGVTPGAPKNLGVAAMRPLFISTVAAHFLLR
jgi:hypothetical protein